MRANGADTENSPTIKVLIADDDPPTRILLRAAITQWGYEVVEASNGEEAWDVLKKPNPPQLLILDWLMPKLDGITLCSRIKKEHIPHTYTILLTQVTGTTNIIKGLEAGADEFLSKPFNMAELRSRLSVGARIIKFENALANQNKAVSDSSEMMRRLRQAINAEDADEVQTQVHHLLHKEIEKLGGTLSVDNRPGGVRVIIDLPAKPGNE
jgi:DNA-binding response OmpR family regulator